MKTEERTCRFCFTICCKFKSIDGDIKEVSNVVLPGIVLAAVQEPVMCKLCEEILFTSLDFKVRCLYTHDFLIPFANKKDGVKLNLKDIYMNKNKNNVSLLEDGDVCGFCICPVENSSGKFLDVGERDVMLRNILGQCLPELDLSIIEKPVICAPCQSSLEKHFRFVSDILIIEEKIKKYKRTLDINSNGGDIIKLEKICDSGASVDKGVENECTGSVNMDDLKFNTEQEFTPTNMLADEIESNKIDAIKIKEMCCGDDGITLKEENIVNVGEQKVLLDEEIEIKTDELDFNSFEDDINMAQLNPRTNGRQECSVLPNFVDNLLKPHIGQICINKNVTKITSCSIQTNYKDSLKIHSLRHDDLFEGTMYKCHLCTFQTKHESFLKSHLMEHKNLEVAMLKFDSCPVHTKQISTLKKHVLNDKSPSELTMHTCDLCAYQTIKKSNLKSHLRIHKDISEVTMYKCDLCLYQTKYKGGLKTHLVTCEKSSEVTMHKCDSCEYHTIRKSNLKRHLVKHKNPSKVTMHKCDSCTYQTIRKGRLKSHLLIHKDISEVTVYKCDLCLYQTKYKGGLETHLLTCKNSSKVTMHKCDSCAYQTKYKSALKSHLLIHRGISEGILPVHKCDLCFYLTKYDWVLENHILKHNYPSKVKMHKCDSCAYQTGRKGDLNRHLLKHKNISEVKKNVKM